MKTVLKLLFAVIFVCMVTLIIRTSLQISIWDAWESYAANPWAVATLWDAYAGFLLFYLWVLYKERSSLARAVWLVLIMSLGNIATSLYALIQIIRLRPDQPAEAMLLRHHGREGLQDPAPSLLQETK
ncbi:MAG: DUF1475 domain-containing protein [Acidobacteria bacterium]|nr:DUF1475 domain-containing protein [Acidobacteriota bacterium]